VLLVLIAEPNDVQLPLSGCHAWPSPASPL